jgi:hypothetical protein
MLAGMEGSGLAQAHAEELLAAAAAAKSGDDPFAPGGVATAAKNGSDPAPAPRAQAAKGGERP